VYPAAGNPEGGGVRGKVRTAQVWIGCNVGGWVCGCAVAEDLPESSCIDPVHLLEVFGKGE